MVYQRKNRQNRANVIFETRRKNRNKNKINISAYNKVFKALPKLVKKEI